MSSSKACCIICSHIYTDKEIFQLAKVSEGHMRIECPVCGQSNIHKAIEIMEEEKGDDINASGSEGTN